MMDFFFDAPLNATLAHRCLVLLEDMDQARFRKLNVAYDRPAVYKFIEEMYADGVDNNDAENDEQCRVRYLVGPLKRHSWSDSVSRRASRHENLR